MRVEVIGRHFTGRDFLRQNEGLPQLARRIDSPPLDCAEKSQQEWPQKAQKAQKRRGAAARSQNAIPLPMIEPRYPI
jgi:hypothetical protein